MLFRSYIGDLIANVPVGDGSAYAGIEGIKSPYMNDLAGYIAGYQGKVGDGHLSASLFEPKDHENSGRQAMINYSMPFAEGGRVSTDDTALDDYAQLLSDYPEAQAFLHKFNEQNFEPSDSIIASTLAHPIEAAKRLGNKFTENVNTLMGYPDLESAEPLYQRPDSEKVKAALDLAGLAQTGALPFAPEDEVLMSGFKIPKRLITVNEPLRTAFPDIYARPDEIALKASKNVAPEDPALKQLFGVTRDDLYELRKTRTEGNEDRKSTRLNSSH